ncbi:MAG: TlpA family protein disulfide reductase [Gemmataceae bacterium]|nr:TlpA family protein disulfide reductase [Gemmataceae bacterium]
MRCAMLLLAVGSVLAQKPDPKKFPAVALEGKQAPAFKTDFGVDGKPATLADLKGKVVLLDFWAVSARASRSALPELAKLHDKHAPKGLEVVGLTRYYKRWDFKGGKLVEAKRPLAKEQEQAMLSAFAKDRKIPYRIQTSEDAVFAYRVNSFPLWVLIDKKGVVRMVRAGYGPENLKALDARIEELLKE